MKEEINQEIIHFKLQSIKHPRSDDTQLFQIKSKINMHCSLRMYFHLYYIICASSKRAFPKYARRQGNHPLLTSTHANPESYAHFYIFLNLCAHIFLFSCTFSINWNNWTSKIESQSSFVRIKSIRFALHHHPK